MSNKRNICATTLAITAAVVTFQAQAQAQAQAQEDVVRPLSDWDYEAIYEAGGIRADNLLGAEVFGGNGEEIGSVENVLITQENKVAAIIAQVGGFWDMGDTHVLVPWEEVELNEEGVITPVTEDNVDKYGLFTSDDYITEQDLAEAQQVDDDLETGPGIWKLTDLLDDYATIGEGVGYGYVHNMLLSRNGEVQAVIVESDTAYGRGTYAYPFYGYGYGWAPGYPAYALQYDADEIGEMKPFDYEKYDGLWD